MNADCNLLLGILALQMDFIERDALIAAMNAWVLDKAKPLGEILEAQGKLSPERRQLLDALVSEHVKQHGNDPEKSLAALSSVSSIRADLERIADPDLESTLVHMSGVRDNDPHEASTVSAGARTSSGLRFTILRPHAKGGLGQVSVALDEELNREVAFKEIQDSHADDAVSRSRFLLEAEITGGLEHPGIIPVYGLGKYGNGRPFYAMRFVKGDSLQAAIKRFHEADQSNPDPGERSLELRKLLGRMIDVCNAIEYAHSRRVLHRDLKPGNIMLGKYGETLVVDWGLAKPLCHRESSAESDEPSLRPASASGPGFTQMGSAIGTPQYMSPEQAGGRLDELGPATDVYSLGATLYCLLTGRPPFMNSDALETAARVCTGDFAPPRRVNPDVPTALQAICLKAMSLKPGDRYPSTRALADDLEHWLADEPVSVYTDPPSRRFARWTRNHKGTVGAVVAAVVVLVVGGLVASTMARRANERIQNITRAEGLVESLVNAETEQVPDVVKQLAEQPTFAMPLLAEKLAHAKDGSTEKLHVSLALVQSGVENDKVPVKYIIEYLYEQLLRSEAAQFPIIRDALADHSARITNRLWTVLAGSESDPQQQRLRAAGALAKYDPRNPKWTDVAPEVTNQLVSVNPLFIRQWQESLRPVADSLLSPLAKIFIDPEQGELPRALVVSMLADFAKDDPDTLTNLVIYANNKEFGTLFPMLRSHGAAAIERLQTVLDRELRPTWSDPPLDPRWTEPPTPLRAAIEAAHGILAERFAFCQDLAWDQFRQHAESLRPSGYRPVRVRPYGRADNLLVAAIWKRDGKRWELESDLARDQLPASDAPAEKGDLVPTDAAVLPLADQAAGTRFVLLWGESDSAGEQRRLLVDAGKREQSDSSGGIQLGTKIGANYVGKPELTDTQAAMAKQGFAAQSAIGVWTDAVGQRHYLGIWSNQGAPSELRAAYGGFELVDQPQWDVAAAPAADPLDAYRKQITEIAKLPDAQAEQPISRLARAKAQFHLGQLEAALADLDAAFSGFLLLQEKYTDLAIDYSEVHQYRSWTLARLGKAEEARLELAKYLVQAKNPSMRAYVQVVSASWLGDYDQAAEVLGAAAAAAMDSADGLYNAACAAAMASEACEISDVQRAAAFKARAIELIEEAIAHGYQDGAQLRVDVDLAVLHRDQRFKDLVDRLDPPARYAAVWRADVEFESLQVESTSLQKQLEQARESVAQGYRPVAIAVFDERAAVAELVREPAAPGTGILASLTTNANLPRVSSVWHRPVVPDKAKEEFAQRQATAAMALLRMGAAERVWPLFEHRPDPRLRSYLLDRLAPYGAEPAVVLTQLRTESDVSRRRAMILAIGQFARAKLLSAERTSAAVSDLIGWYADDTDAGIHGAAEWSLRQLGAHGEIARLRQAFATGSVVGDRQWYVTKKGGHTLVIVRPDEQFLMGSPVAEVGRSGGPTGKWELRHREHEQANRGASGDF